MDRGVDLAVIASLMGHRSPQETGVYLHVLLRRTEAAVRTLPLGNGAMSSNNSLTHFSGVPK
jgi:integrase